MQKYFDNIHSDGGGSDDDDDDNNNNNNNNTYLLPQLCLTYLLT